VAQALTWFQVFLSNAIPMLCLAEIHDSTSTCKYTSFSPKSYKKNKPVMHKIIIYNQW